MARRLRRIGESRAARGQHRQATDERFRQTGQENIIHSNGGKSHSGRRNLIIGVAALVLLVLAGLWRWRGDSFHWGAFASAFKGLNALWLTASIILILSTYYGRALRWEVMLRPLNRRASIAGLYSATAIGFTAIVLLGRPGEMVRPWLISVKERVPFSSQVAAWVLERIYDLLMVMAIFGFSLARVPWATLPLKPGVAQWFHTGGYVVGGIAASCIVLLIALGGFEGHARRVLLWIAGLAPRRLRSRLEEMVDAFLQGMRSAGKTTYVVLISLYTVLEWALILACYYCLFRSFPATARFTLTEVSVFLGVVAFGSVIQIPGIGGGVQVAAVVALTQIFGLPLEPATALALLIWVVTFMTVVPVGLALALHNGINWRKFRHLPEDALV